MGGVGGFESSMRIGEDRGKGESGYWPIVSLGNGRRNEKVMKCFELH